jgi:hypothetical protein
VAAVETMVEARTETAEAMAIVVMAIAAVMATAEAMAATEAMAEAAKVLVTKVDMAATAKVMTMRLQVAAVMETAEAMVATNGTAKTVIGKKKKTWTSAVAVTTIAVRIKTWKMKTGTMKAAA